MLKLIGIIFLTYLLIKYLARILAPILLNRFVNKMNQRFQNQFHKKFNQQQDPFEKEGNVSVKIKPKKSKTDTNDMGEYVDFEEVED